MYLGMQKDCISEKSNRIREEDVEFYIFCRSIRSKVPAVVLANIVDGLDSGRNKSRAGLRFKDQSCVIYLRKGSCARGRQSGKKSPSA